MATGREGRQQQSEQLNASDVYTTKSMAKKSRGNLQVIGKPSDRNLLNFELTGEISEEHQTHTPLSLNSCTARNAWSMAASMYALAPASEFAMAILP